MRDISIKNTNDFKNYQLLVILFRETANNNVIFSHNRFIGFKRASFDENFIESVVKPIWIKIRELVNNNELKEVFELTNAGSIRLSPKTKLPISSPNFPKSKDYAIFVRGSGYDKSKLPLEINGIKMLTQYIWIRGSTIIEIMNNNIDFNH